MSDSPSKPSGSGSKPAPPAYNPWLLWGAAIELGASVAILTLGGWWLDNRWGTGPWLTLAGLALGFTVGFTHLWKAIARYTEAEDARLKGGQGKKP
ncbi:MAG: AtpZ/AtpI family protein [Phycisphaeraceae bacterium]|nr:AtpZ/AtpI family protein [Phycisphaeraceae bacterium]